MNDDFKPAGDTTATTLDRGDGNLPNPEVRSARPGPLFYLGWVLAIAVAFGSIGALLLARSSDLSHRAAQRRDLEQQGRRVLVQPVMHPPTSRVMQLPATIHGYTETPIYAKISGYLREINVDKGDRVRKGQVLAVLESPELDQQVANARATYNLDVITDNRNQALAREGVVAQQVADDSHNAMLAAKATLEQSQAMGAYRVIAAPFSGVITARYVDPGALIPQATATAGGTPIVAMATLSPLRVYAEVPQQLAPYVRDGDPASVTVGEFPGREFAGRITRHPAALATATRTMLVEVDLPNREGILYPGMYASLTLHTVARVAARMVPDETLVFHNGKPFVPVVRENTLRLIPVSLGYDNGAAVEVSGDLTDQDMVAVNVGQAAHDGEHVQPISAQQ